VSAYIDALLVLGVLGAVLSVLLSLARRRLAHYGPCSVKINDREPVVIDGGGKLLDALYDQSIFIPSACGGQGTCGYCKVEVVSGGGVLLPTEIPFLTESEVQRGVRLACQVKIKQDVQIKVEESLLNIKEFRARVSSVRALTHDTRELAIKLLEPATMPFKPGQYIQVLVPSKGERIFRAYSISSPPAEDGSIELVVRLVPGGVGSSYLHRVAVGDDLVLTGPYGDFELDPDKHTELICVGGGCGIAPMHSIIRHVALTQPKRHCSLYIGAATSGDVMYQEEFAALQKTMPHLSVHYAISDLEASPDWEGERGHIHQLVEKLLKEKPGRQAFLCGPPVMIEAVSRVLIAKGFTKDRIFYDEF
jgi:Na+-transporting NADH:ubiquinone oxidoreductase subunit F